MLGITSIVELALKKLCIERSQPTIRESIMFCHIHMLKLNAKIYTHRLVQLSVLVRKASLGNSNGQSRQLTCQSAKNK